MIYFNEDLGVWYGEYLVRMGWSVVDFLFECELEFELRE